MPVIPARLVISTPVAAWEAESVGEEVRGGNNMWANLTMRMENSALNQDAIN